MRSVHCIVYAAHHCKHVKLHIVEVFLKILFRSDKICIWKIFKKSSRVLEQDPISKSLFKYTIFYAIIYLYYSIIYLDSS